MRDKFSELIDAGVASFTYKDRTSNPSQDDVCRVYNNIYSIPSDTRMSIVDGYRYITGHMLKDQSRWITFCMSPTWGGVDFRNTTGSVMNFLTNKGLTMFLTYLNDEIAYKIVPKETNNLPVPSQPMSYTTTESRIPQPISLLITDNNSLRIKECFNETKNPYEIAKKFNESIYIKGDNWTVFENKLIGTVNKSNCIITLYESADEYIRYVLRLEGGPSGSTWLRINILDEMYDSRSSTSIDKHTYKYSGSNKYDIAGVDNILKKVNSNVVKTLKSLEIGQVYEIYGKDPWDSKMKIRPAKYRHGGIIPGTYF